MVRQMAALGRFIGGLTLPQGDAAPHLMSAKRELRAIRGS
jgi:hypothetical protein